jgi:hypothetical protein
LLRLFVCEINASACGRNQRRIKAQPAAGTLRFRLLDGALDTGEDELAGGASLTGRGLMQAAVQLARQIDAGADGAGLHEIIVERPT